MANRLPTQKRGVGTQTKGQFGSKTKSNKAKKLKVEFGFSAEFSTYRAKNQPNRSPFGHIASLMVVKPNQQKSKIIKDICLVIP